MTRGTKAILTLWLMMGLLAPMPVRAVAGTSQGAATVDETLYREISNELRCPSCAGLSILESQASFSVEMREEVRRQLQQNKSKDAILDFFVERYGSWILRKPPLRGISLLIWALPALLALLGITLGVVLFRRRGSSRHGNVAADKAKIAARTRDQLRDELNARVARMRENERAPS